MKHYLYDHAAQKYKEALNVGVSAKTHILRVSEKLARASSLGHNPTVASTIYDDILLTQLPRQTDGLSRCAILRRRAYQLWIDAKTRESLPLLKKAMQIAEKTSSRRAIIIAKAKMADYMMALGCYNEAKTFLAEIGSVRPEDDTETRAVCYSLHGVFAAAFGDPTEAFRYFDLAVDAGKESDDILFLANSWRIYGYWATELGDILRARTCYRRALLVARQYHLTWEISLTCLEYANLLFITGQHNAAHQYLLESLSYDVHCPQMECRFAAIGIPIAIKAHDDITLSRCAQTSAITAVLESGQLDQVASVISAFCQWYNFLGDAKMCSDLLRRAEQALRDCDVPEAVWTFPIAAARYGGQHEQSAARRLLLRRVTFPCNEVSRACLSLFDAFVSRRYSTASEATEHAGDAFQRFKALGWYGYAELAGQVLHQDGEKGVPMDEEATPFSDIAPKLTSRERQVAGLALKGLTNKEIAAVLLIKERTVEAHMTSILGRLGVRSRYQLTDRAGTM